MTEGKLFECMSILRDIAVLVFLTMAGLTATLGVIIGVAYLMAGRS